MDEANEGLKDGFESTRLEFEERLRLQAVERRNFRQELEREVGVLAGKLEGLRCQEREWELRLTRIMEDEAGLSHH